MIVAQLKQNSLPAATPEGPLVLSQKDNNIAISYHIFAPFTVANTLFGGAWLF